MSKPIERALMTCLIAALPMTLAPAAFAQSDSESLSGGPKRIKVPGVEEPAEGTESEPGTEASTEEVTEVLPEDPDSAEAEPPAEEAAASGAEFTNVLPEADAAEEADIFPEGDAVDQMAQSDEAEAEAETAAESEASSESEPAGTTTETVVETDEAGTGPFVGDYTIGDPEAPVQVIEYASFTCPHCADYHRNSWADLKADYVDTGKIGFTLREVYFDRFGLWASMAARCGGEAAFYPMAEQFLKKRDEWTGAEDIPGAIAKIGRLNGLTDEQMKACLENQDFAKLLVDEYKANAEDDDIRSTPTFVVRGPDGDETIVGNKPEDVEAAIEQALSGS